MFVLDVNESNCGVMLPSEIKYIKNDDEYKHQNSNFDLAIGQLKALDIKTSKDK